METNFNLAYSLQENSWCISDDVADPFHSKMIVGLDWDDIVKGKPE